mmetsp:Transcript_97901/g.174340  ORF Transcript_97901/g.174340 Transcript_97901/m.174340 type:complete len:215 (-) Transcript_97901:203-847(-)
MHLHKRIARCFAHQMPVLGREGRCAKCSDPKHSSWQGQLEKCWVNPLLRSSDRNCDAVGQHHCISNHRTDHVADEPCNAWAVCNISNAREIQVQLRCVDKICSDATDDGQIVHERLHADDELPLQRDGFDTNTCNHCRDFYVNIRLVIDSQCQLETVLPPMYVNRPQLGGNCAEGELLEVSLFQWPWKLCLELGSDLIMDNFLHCLIDLRPHSS